MSPLSALFFRFIQLLESESLGLLLYLGGFQPFSKYLFRYSQEFGHMDVKSLIIVSHVLSAF